jgi:predicted secreted protein
VKVKQIHMIKFLYPIILILSMLLLSTNVMAQDLVEPTPGPAEDSLVGESVTTGTIVLVSPANKSFTNNVDPTFTWTDDPSNPAAAFHWQLARDSKFSDIVADHDDIPAPSTSTSGLGEGKYYWRVQGKYGGGALGQWSKVWFFTVDTTPPAPPILKKPKEPSYTSKQYIIFTWKWVDKDSLVAKPNLRICGSGDADAWELTGTKYKYPTPLDFGIYCWFASAQDRAGNWSTDSSPSQWFMITLLKKPATGSYIKGNVPKFSWAAHPDAKTAPAPQYEIMVDDDPDFLSPEAESGVVGNVIKYTWPASLSSGTWYWTIRFSPDGGSTWEDWMPTFSFCIDYCIF